MFNCVLLCGLLPFVFGLRPSVTIQDGTLVGISMNTWMGRQISAFMNIPFAAPPTGPNRFLPPQPVIPWNGTRDAGSLAPFCTQLAPSAGDGTIEGVEDCLYLNVYTPGLKSNTSAGGGLPILLYFHGGGFMFLGANQYGPRYLLDHDMILVTTNYRLGILGFMTTGDEVVTGNMGLKDQVAAMRWIQTNIAAFGGNPNEVTLAGTSAGAASVHYHYLSRQSRGLFKRGICQSGSVLIPSALQKAPIEKALEVAAALNCSSSSSLKMVDCLRTVPAGRIAATERMFQFFYYNPFAPFGPVVETLSPQPFINQLPYETLRTGNLANLPMVASTTTHEGLFPVAEFIANETSVEYLNSNWERVAPAILDYIYTVSRDNMNSTSTKIRNYYYGNAPITQENIQHLVSMAGDRTFTDDGETAARLQAFVNSAPVYYYQFGYRGQNSLSNLLSGTTNNYGVSHGDDSFYILNSTYISAEGTVQDRQMITIMSTMWASFTINGVPQLGNSTWTPLTANNSMTGPLNYMLVASPMSIGMKTAVSLGQMKFWDSLPLAEPGSGRPAL